MEHKYRVHGRTVRQAIADAVPPERKTPERESRSWRRSKELIRGWLTDDLMVPRKQPAP